MKLARPQTDSAAAFVPRREEELTSQILRKAMALWKAQCPTDGLPMADDFDIFDYQQVIGHINLVDVCEPPLEFVFRVHSVAGSDYVGLDLTGRSVCDYPDPQYGALVREVCRRAKRERTAQIVIEDVLVRRRQTNFECLFRWEAAIMPLEGSHGEVARLVFAFDLQWAS